MKVRPAGKPGRPGKARVKASQKPSKANVPMDGEWQCE